MPFDALETIRVPAKSTAAPTTRQKIDLVATWFENHGTRSFGPLLNVEKMTPQTLAATKTAGTLFEYFGGALLEADIKAPDMPTMSAVMNEFGLSQDQIDKVGCYCVHQTGMALGSHVAYMLRTVTGVSNAD